MSKVKLNLQRKDYVQLLIYAKDHTAAMLGNVNYAFLVPDSAMIGGLISGTRHAFRMRALGPNELESPWSDEAICKAP